MTEATAPGESVRDLFREGPFRLLFTMRLTSNTASQMIGVIVSWQIYEITGSALQLGMIGLIQFLPPLALTLFAGQVADRYDRRWILRIGLTSQLVVPVGFIVLTNMAAPPVWAFYVLLLILAIARTFDSPAQQAILPSMVPRELVAQAISISTSAQKISALAGPALGGAIIIFSVSLDYAICLGLLAIAALASYALKPPEYGDPAARGRTWNTVFSGLQFIFKQPVILGLMSLDLLATFFGGVAALLPIFAKDILDVGPVGLGLLRAGPAIGALAMGIVLARFPVRRRAGRWLFGGVAVYGVATIIFGFSENMILSMACMLAVGAGDMLGQVLRQTIIQLRTPDAMRGRVAAVSNLSVTVGSQLGQFESGVVAALVGAVGSVFIGGAAAVLIVAVWMKKFPQITNIEHPEEEAVP
ncbi:MAG: MFS transporter [Alphaproteobacteria bacterium]|nr:MFS transporter [Alphaproteobacteria bacterium]